MKDKKEKRRWGLILFIVMIMIGTSFSFVYFGFSPSNGNIRYNGIKFTGYPDRWEAKINGKLAAFSFLPADVEKMAATGNLSSRLQEKLEIDVTSELNSSLNESIALAEHQMSLTLWNYDVYIRKGFTSNNTFNFPIITCDDATANVPIVYFRESNETRIFEEDGCLIAEAASAVDMIKVKDRIIYGALGVMK